MAYIIFDVLYKSIYITLQLVIEQDIISVFLFLCYTTENYIESAFSTFKHKIEHTHTVYT
jgi:hypothetical protein